MSETLSERSTNIFIPTQDYIARTFGYGIVAAVVAVGLVIEFFAEHSVVAIAFCLLYPHLLYILAKPFYQQSDSATRQFQIHGDALLFGFFLSYLQFPFELVVLFSIMINTTFIVVGSVTAWAFCVVSVFAGAAAGFLVFGYQYPGSVPDILIIVAAIGVGLHLAFTAYNSNVQARYLMMLKVSNQRQMKRLEELSSNVSKYVSPQIWESIFTGKNQARLETQRKQLVVFFSDLVGFSSLSDHMDAEAFTDVLNGYLSDMSQIALKHGGTIDKFIGDGMMVFFGDPKSKGLRQDAIDCVSMAIEMQEHMETLNKRWALHGHNIELKVRMGINTGYCAVGNFGTSKRMDYTILGKAVNIASRLESRAEAGEILISGGTYQLVKDKIACSSRGDLQVRGFRDPVTTFNVNGHLSEDQQPLNIGQEMEGFKLLLDGDRLKGEDRKKVAATLEKAARALRTGQQNEPTNVIDDADPRRDNQRQSDREIA